MTFDDSYLSSLSRLRNARLRPMLRLDVVGVGTISFPVPELQAREIIRLAERAPYGRGERTVVDTTVRKAGRSRRKKSGLAEQPGRRLLKPSWRRWLKVLDVSTTTQMLNSTKCCYTTPVVSSSRSANTEKTEGMFGTLIIVLPFLNSGGEVVVRPCRARSGAGFGNNGCIST
jgi:hypothetical protein